MRQPKSYVHALLKFKNGLIKIIAHDTTMEIPIFNTLFNNTSSKVYSKKIDINLLNNLQLNKVDAKRFPMINLLKLLPEKLSLYETIIVSANDALVELYLKEKIKFTDINKKLLKFIQLKEFLKFKKISPNNMNDIIDLNSYVRLKIIKKSV